MMRMGDFLRGAGVFQCGRCGPACRCVAVVLGMALWSISRLSGEDPSSLAAADASTGTGYAERWRVVVDLDGDGKDDLLLSEPAELFGTMGGEWEVYLFRDGDYRKVGALTAHPRALSFERDHDRTQRDAKDRYYARVWVYLRGGGSEGGLGYYRVGEQAVAGERGVTIYPGDGGTDLGRAVYDAVMGHSEIPFRLEYSATDARGRVVWSEVRER